MMTSLMEFAVIFCVAAPGALFLLLALAAWSTRSLSEKTIVRAVALTFALVSIGLVLAAIGMASVPENEVRVPLGTYFEVSHYGFLLLLVLDRLSLPLAALAATLVGLIAAFSSRYLHRERGFMRFYLLLTLFGAGVELVVLAGTLDLVFFGWELVGITSALLIAFFDERPSTSRHGLRAYVTYRVCDVGLLTAAVWLHHTAGTSMLSDVPTQTWSALPVPRDTIDATLVGLLLCWAAIGKSAQLPFSGWLPRAMEGPTPSSAIFYGALSIHLGPYLLLRAAPILERAPIAAAAVVLVGASTALHATFVGRVQTDIKSALAYASMAQVGLIFVEIGLGLRFFAIAHIIGHACVRTLQLLRAPSLLHDHHHLEQAMGSHLPRTGGHLERLVPTSLQPWLYRLALERGYLDSILFDYILGGAVRLLRGVDRLEERWVLFLQGNAEPPAKRSEEALR